MVDSVCPCRNQGSRGKVVRMIKIIFDVKRRYLPTTVYSIPERGVSGVRAGYERGMSGM
jgi:hypothetical protein